jgi:hypothetical protein
MVGIGLLNALASIYSSFIKILLDAKLIEIARELGFPEFS